MNSYSYINAWYSFTTRSLNWALSLCSKLRSLDTLKRWKIYILINCSWIDWFWAVAINAIIQAAIAWLIYNFHILGFLPRNKLSLLFTIFRWSDISILIMRVFLRLCFRLLFIDRIINTYLLILINVDIYLYKNWFVICFRKAFILFLFCLLMILLILQIS